MISTVRFRVCERDALGQHALSGKPATRAARGGTVPEVMRSHLPLPLATVDGHARRRSAYIRPVSRRHCPLPYGTILPTKRTFQATRNKEILSIAALGAAA
jgi:hypothetical protein